MNTTEKNTETIRPWQKSSSRNKQKKMKYVYIFHHCNTGQTLVRIIKKCCENVTNFKYFRRATNKLTPWSKVLLEKLTATQLVKKFPTSYGTQGP
jgi:hypothetical protein